MTRDYTLREFEFTIDVSVDADLSDAIEFGDFTPSKMIIPDSMDSTSVTFEVESGGSYVPFKDENNSDISVTIGSSAACHDLGVTQFAGVKNMKIKTNANETNDRTVTVVAVRAGNIG